MISSLAKSERGKLEPDWGVSPKRIKTLFGEEENDLGLPILLHPGEVLIIRISSDDIIKEFRLFGKVNRVPKWTRTKNMMLEITHSMSKNIHEESFELEKDELERADKAA
jgi:hypothetical protein